MKHFICLAITAIFFQQLSAEPVLPTYREYLSLVRQGGDDGLRNDPLFAEMIRNDLQFSSELYKALGKDDQKLADARQEVERLQNQPLSDDEALEQLASIVNIPASAIRDYYQAFRHNWTTLLDRYGDQLTETYVQDEAQELAKYAPDVFFNEVSLGCRDPKRYAICAAAAAAAAVLAHAACVATLFGVIPCVIAVALAEINAINDCARNWC